MSSSEVDQYLPARGVLPETAAAYQVEVVHSPTCQQLEAWLGKNGQQLEAAVVFPNLTLDDDGTIYPASYAVRCFPPLVWGDGKTRKFLATSGIDYRPYVLPPVWSVTQNIGAPIYIVEKQTAALLLQQIGCSAIALDGTYGVAAKRVDGEPVTLHPALVKFAWINRPVFLLFDSDFLFNSHVLQGLIRSYCSFSVASALVRVVQWDQAFKGLDDFIAARAGLDPARQREELDALISALTPLSAKEAAGKWITPQMRTLFEREVAAIQPGMSERSMLAECIHAALGTTAADLKKSWGISCREAPEEEEDALLKHFNSIKPWPAPVPVSEILWETHDKLEKYVVTQPYYRIVAAAWVGMTYVFEESPFLPMMIFSSPQEESGKSAFMTTMTWMVYRPVPSSLISSAGAHRWIDVFRGTICTDEVKSMADKPDMVALWNLGFNNSGHAIDTPVVRRYDSESGKTLQFRVSYSKMMAGLGSFLTSDTISRSFVVPMRRALPAELDSIEDYVFITPEEFAPITQKWTQWREKQFLTFRADVLKTMRMMPKDIRGRAKQKFAPLFTVCRLAGDGWYEMIEKSALEMLKIVPPGADARLNRLLLRDLYFIGKHELRLKKIGRPSVIVLGREAKQDFITSDDWVKALHKLRESPWRAWGKYRKILDAKDMYWLLQDYGIGEYERFRERWSDLHGIYLETVFKAFEPYKTPNDRSPFGDEDNDEPDPSGPSSPSSPDTPSAPKNPRTSETDSPKTQNVEKGENRVPTVPESMQVVENVGFDGGNQGKNQEVIFDPDSPCQTAAAEGLTTNRGVGEADFATFPIIVPPSTPAAGFCIATHPERYIGLDLETFYPWPSEGEISSKERKRRKEGKAHLYAKDPRRNVIRLLTIHDGTQIRTFDFFTETVPDDVRDLLRNSTLIIHNADFDLTVLRRHGFEVSSSIFDTLLASQLLSLGEVEPKRRKRKGQKKPKTVSSPDPEEAFGDAVDDDDGDNEEIEFESIYVPVPNDLSAVVSRYLGVAMEKAETNLGASDWSVNLTPEQLAYARDDAVYFQVLRLKLTQELDAAGQWTNFQERSAFLVHLNNVKFAGIPVDREMLLTDKAQSEQLVGASKAELREMFKDYRPLVPKSRLRKSKLKKVDSTGAVFDATPQTEEINPGYHVHIKAALAAHGIVVENTQKATLSAIDSPETRAFCRYAEQTKLLSIIKGIEKSIFHDGRVRSAQWNQLVARSGRIIPREPNVQQLPRKWRKPFRILPPWFWLKMDLSQIEIYILAIHCQCLYLIELLSSGKDIYVLIAAEIFNKAPRRGEGENEVTEILRETTKTLVLGIAYCLGYRSFIRRVEIATRPSFGAQGKLYSPEEAKEFYAKFFEMFPEVKFYQDRMFGDALTEDFVYTATGQRRFLPPLLNDEEPNGYWPSRSYRHHVLVNTPIQGGAACHYIRSINKLIPRLPPTVELIHLIHDEVGLQVTQETAQATLEAVTLSFQEAFAEIFGTQLTVKLEPQLSDSWAKLPKEKK
jgi:DNA polymerase I-like protein with 3'-5' exonuclease and polymerase domains